MREFKAVVALADLLDEDAVPVELPQPRVCAAVIDEYVTFGIRGHADGFTERVARRNLQEVRNRCVGNFGNILRRGLQLRERRNRTQHKSQCEYARNTTLHFEASRLAGD